MNISDNFTWIDQKIFFDVLASNPIFQKYHYVYLEESYWRVEPVFHIQNHQRSLGSRISHIIELYISFDEKCLIGSALAYSSKKSHSVDLIDDQKYLHANQGICLVKTLKLSIHMTRVVQSQQSARRFKQNLRPFLKSP